MSVPIFRFYIRTGILTKRRRVKNHTKLTCVYCFSGQYSFVDDIGERHDVSYIAGRDTGFHVSSAFPDSPRGIGSPFHRVPLVRSEKNSRGKTAVQRGLDGSYR